MTTSIHVQITPEQLKVLIQEAVSSCLNGQKKITKKLLSLDEAAIYLGLPKNTLYQLTSQRRISFLKIGKRNMFEEEVLIEWARSKRKKTRKEIEEEL
jgi:excisionase family DNA binding protein